MQPKTLLHLEGGTLLAASLILYAYTGGNWLIFALLILAPDLSALGYLAGNRAGAYTYNLFHTYLLPAILGIYGLLGSNPLALQIALIWFAHIGGDRLLGYGLKYPSAFKDTHLNRV
jgi:Domain of unknown function (DUF4260)